MFKTFFLFSALIITPLFSHSIVYSNISENIYKKNKLVYKIKAEKKVQNFKKNTSMLFLNRKKYIADNFYYEKGSIFTKVYNINFKRMYIYGQTVYLSKVTGIVGEYTFRGKDAKIYKDRIEFSKFFFKRKERKGSKINFIFYFKR